MRRYLIIGLAVLSGIIVFFITLYLLKKVLKKETTFYALISGLLAFIGVLLFCFLYLEKDAGDILLKYNPPELINGEVISGTFKKN